MSTRDLDAQITAHYSSDDLTQAILTALAAAGKAEDRLTPDDVAPLDQFHTRGKVATLELAERAGVTAATRVLDLGGGIGGAARLLATTFGCQVEVLDLTEAYCHAGQLLTARCGLSDRVAFQYGSATEPPYSDEQFDIVWMQHSTMNITDKARLFREARRVLRPDGRLALHEVLAGPVPEVSFPVPWAREAATSFLCQPEELRALITAAGFIELAWHEETEAAARWFQQRLARAAVQSTPSPLGLHLLLGHEAPAMLRNLLCNLEKRRVRVVQAVFARC
jgi:SAM-dependent methyltransferase